MRFKLDENLSESVAQLFRGEGYDVQTVASQHISGIDDQSLIEICRQEQRCLVTLDMDFANPLRFKPSNYYGIAVLRTPARTTLDDIKALAGTLIEALRHQPIGQQLWIVQKGRIRIYMGEPPPQDAP